MSDLIRGTDVVIETVRDGFDLPTLLDGLLDIWPDAVIQDADAEGVEPLAAVVKGTGSVVGREFFLYKAAAAAARWERDGWTEEYGNDMVHFLVADDATRPGGLQVTLVIDAFTGEVVRLLDVVLDALGRMSDRSGAAPERSRRVDWDADLREVGYDLGRESFYNKVEELREAFYPGWTADELACHPHDALQFCEVVRKAVDRPVPDHLVMKALLNRRRQSRKGPAAKPRVVWSA